jgi:hypothetical protein
MPMAPPPMVPDDDRTEIVMVPPPMAAVPAHEVHQPPLEAVLDARRMSALRGIRAEVQDLEATLSAISRGETSPKDNERYLLKTVQDVEALLVTDVTGEHADGVTRVNNLWEQLRGCPLLVDPAVKLDPQDMQRHLNAAIQRCNRIVNEIGNLTIPARLQAWLKTARPGYYVPFHAVFQDEMPDAEARNALLNYLAWATEALKGGLVDQASGLIYRYAESRRERFFSYLLLFAGLASAGAIVCAAPYLPFDGWPLEESDFGTLIIGWGAILAGVIFHLGVGLTKRAQSEGRPPVLALGDLPLMINARGGAILLKVYMTLVGLFGLTFSAGIEEVTPLNAFLIGYALDSVVELFGAGVEQAANASTGRLKKGLTG